MRCWQQLLCENQESMLRFSIVSWIQLMWLNEIWKLNWPLLSERKSLISMSMKGLLAWLWMTYLHRILRHTRLSYGKILTWAYVFQMVLLIQKRCMFVPQKNELNHITVFWFIIFTIHLKVDDAQYAHSHRTKSSWKFAVCRKSCFSWYNLFETTPDWKTCIGFWNSEYIIRFSWGFWSESRFAGRIVQFAWMKKRFVTIEKVPTEANK